MQMMEVNLMTFNDFYYNPEKILSEFLYFRHIDYSDVITFDIKQDLNKLGTANKAFDSNLLKFRKFFYKSFRDDLSVTQIKIIYLFILENLYLKYSIILSEAYDILETNLNQQEFSKVKNFIFFCETEVSSIKEISTLIECDLIKGEFLKLSRVIMEKNYGVYLSLNYKLYPEINFFSFFPKYERNNLILNKEINNIFKSLNDSPIDKPVVLKPMPIAQESHIGSRYIPKAPSEESAILPNNKLIEYEKNNKIIEPEEQFKYSANPIKSFLNNIFKTIEKYIRSFF
jgi:hypothetical protein